jgi:hypothetical protein
VPHACSGLLSFFLLVPDLIGKKEQTSLLQAIQINIILHSLIKYQTNYFKSITLAAGFFFLFTCLKRNKKDPNEGLQALRWLVP